MTVAIREFPAAPAISRGLENGLREGANFRTGLQLHNRAASEASARLVLRQADGSAKALTYTLAGPQTKSDEDVVAALGANRLLARAYDDGGSGRTKGVSVPARHPSDAISAGQTAETGYSERCRRTC